MLPFGSMRSLQSLILLLIGYLWPHSLSSFLVRSFLVSHLIITCWGYLSIFVILYYTSPVVFVCFPWLCSEQENISVSCSYHMSCDCWTSHSIRWGCLQLPCFVFSGPHIPLRSAYCVLPTSGAFHSPSTYVGSGHNTFGCLTSPVFFFLYMLGAVRTTSVNSSTTSPQISRSTLVQSPTLPPPTLPLLSHWSLLIPVLRTICRHVRSQVYFVPDIF